MIACGIYLLYYETDDFQYYVGQSSNIEKRYKDHCRYLKSNTHCNKTLSELYNVVGVLPTIEILEVLECTNSILDSREIYWIKEFDCFYNGINGTIGGNSLGKGENHPRALYTNDEIINTMNYTISHKEDSLTKISTHLSIPYGTISSIACGKSHTWLQTKFPNEYKELLSIVGSRKHNSTGYLFPNSVYSAKEIEKVLFLLIHGYSVKDISIQLCIHTSTIYNIKNGSKHTWLKDKYPIEYQRMLNISDIPKECYVALKSPNGTIHNIVDKNSFIKEFGLCQPSISKLLSGKLKSHKGWTLANVSKIEH